MEALFDVPVEETSALGRKARLTVPRGTLKQAVEGRLEVLSKRVRVDGFRPGRAPLHVVSKKYALQARQEAVQAVLERTVQGFFQAKSLRPAGPPAVELEFQETLETLEAIERGELPFSFQLSFEIYPTIELKDLNKLKIIKKKAIISEQDVDEAVLEARRDSAIRIMVERPSQSGDFVTVSYRSQVDGQAQEGGEVEAFVMETGQGRYLRGFEEAILGHGPGGKVQVSLTYPEDWHPESLAGKIAHFEITVDRVEAVELAPFESVAEAMGLQEKTEEAVRGALRAHLEATMARASFAHAKEQLLEALYSTQAFDVPRALVQREQEALHRALHDAHEKEPCAHDQADLEAKARRRVALGLLLAEVVRVNDLRLDESKLRAKIREEVGLAVSDGGEMERLLREDRGALLQRLQELTLVEQAIDHLLGRVTQEEELVALADLKRS